MPLLVKLAPAVLLLFASQGAAQAQSGPGYDLVSRPRTSSNSLKPVWRI